MENKQIALLMQIISTNYPNQLKNIDSSAYYNNLKMFIGEADYILVANNLKKHITNSNFLPTVADLLKQPKKDEVTRPYIPTAEETKKRALMLEENINPAGEEERKKALEDIKRKIREGQKLHEQRIERILNKHTE